MTKKKKKKDLVKSKLDLPRRRTGRQYDQDTFIMEDYVRFLEQPSNVSDVAPSRLGMPGTKSGDLMNVKLQGFRIQDVSLR